MNATSEIALLTTMGPTVLSIISCHDRTSRKLKFPEILDPIFIKLPFNAARLSWELRDNLTISMCFTSPLDDLIVKLTYSPARVLNINYIHRGRYYLEIGC